MNRQTDGDSRHKRVTIGTGKSGHGQTQTNPCAEVAGWHIRTRWNTSTHLEVPVYYAMLVSVTHTV